MSQIVYGNTILRNLGKRGILKPDDDGYYTVVLGALGVGNSAGETYTDTQLSRSTFEPNSSLHTRISKGRLRGEWGHPKPHQYPNMRAYEARCRMIDEDRICCHIRKVWMEWIEVDGARIHAILGEVCPSGPFGGALKKMLDNPDESVCFSGRYWSNLSRVGGRLCREIHTCATWDFVSEPGIDVADKYRSPSLESADSHFLTEHDILAQVKEERENSNLAMSVENGGLSAADIATAFGIRQKKSLEEQQQLKW